MQKDPPHRKTNQADPEVARTRRRAAFLATIRQASEATHLIRRSAVATTRAAPPAARQTQIVKAEPQPQATAPRAAPAPAAQPRPALFREEALKHRLAFEEGRGLVRVAPPWTWALVCSVAVAVVAAIVAACVGKVEVTSRGRGVLRPAAGVRALTSQMTGTVVAVEARSGEHVKKGAALLRIDSPAAQAQLLEAERQLEAVRTQFASASVQQDTHYAEQVQALKARAQRVADQIASLRTSAAYYERRLEADRKLLEKGLVSELAVGEWREQLSQARRQLSGAEVTLDQTRQELASMESRRQDELWQRQQVLAAAKNKRDSLALVMQQSVVQAPQDGTVEALLVKMGEVVQAGQVMGKIVPEGGPLQVVSFLAERDRAFVKPGDEVQLELDQLPHAEYGTLRAEVVRIGDDLASPAEVRDAMGEEAKLEVPSYRVELVIRDAHAAEAAKVKLRTGALMNVRYTLRRQRLITLVFKPLQRWFR